MHVLVNQLVHTVRRHHPASVIPDDILDVVFFRYSARSSQGPPPPIGVRYTVRMASVIARSIRELDLTDTLHAFRHLFEFFKKMQVIYQDSSDDKTLFMDFNDRMKHDASHIVDYDHDEHIHSGTDPVYNALNRMVWAFSHESREMRDAVYAGDHLAWEHALETFISNLSTEDTYRIIVSLENILLRHKHMHALLCEHGPALSVYVKRAISVDTPHAKPVLVSVSSDYATVRDLAAACGHRVDPATNAHLSVVFFTVPRGDIEHKTHKIIYGSNVNIDDLLCRHVRDQQRIWIAPADFDFSRVREPEVGMVDSKWW